MYSDKPLIGEKVESVDALEARMRFKPVFTGLVSMFSTAQIVCLMNGLKGISKASTSDNLSIKL